MFSNTKNCEGVQNVYYSVYFAVDIALFAGTLSITVSRRYTRQVLQVSGIFLLLYHYLASLSSGFSE